MSRKTPIHNGILTSDLEANGHKIIGLQADIFSEQIVEAVKPELDKLEARVTEIEENGSGPAVEVVAPITHADLVTLRKNSGLTPGMQYRITDYVATTKQSNTKSANHPFDIIVTADDVNKLNEVARAIRHEDDTYFANCKLEAWKIWYCLDNDEDRFAWATSSEKIDGVAVAGKGVIYRMIDEWDNDVPYDFKGILTKAYLGDDEWSSDYLYTFGGGADETVTVNPTCYSNKMGVYISLNKQAINQNTFDRNCVENILGIGCYRNNFVWESFCNTLGTNCCYNLLDGCAFNTFGNTCCDNILKFSCHSNHFGNNCYNNEFGCECSSNAFGNDCSENIFEDDCHGNAFGNGCFVNRFGLSCSYNTFGNHCSENIFEDDCRSNAFGNDCFGNRFGLSCSYNTFGNDCSENYWDKDFLENITLQNGVRDIGLDIPSTGDYDIYQNVEIKSGVSNVTITDDNENQSFHTTYKPVGSMEISI